MNRRQDPAAAREGHRTGGPLLFCVLITLAACGGRGGEEGEPAPRDRDVPGRPLEAYRRQGLITGAEDFPAVAGFASVAGPGDSTWVVFGMSLPTSALRFHRDGAGFIAGYSVSLRFTRDGVEHVARRHAEQVRVATFQETGRTAESIFYQDHLLLEPGRYGIELSVSDSIGRRGLEAVDTLDVPSFAGSSPRPAVLLVHEAAGRDSRRAPPDVILNSRHAAAFASYAPLVYVETYDSAATSLELRVTDAAGDSVVSLAVATTASADSSLRYASVALPIESLPLGVLRVSAQQPSTGQSSPGETLLITISDQWMVANYEEVLDYLGYIASRQEIQRLRDAATPAERRAAWEEFWARRDPVPASPVNEYREEFFERVRVAAEQFAEIGRPGWRTDRGEVYIVLGAPDRETHGELDTRDISGAVDAIEWVYERGVGGRMQLLFLDREGFGRYEMTRNSELTFRSIAARLRVPSE